MTQPPGPYGPPYGEPTNPYGVPGQQPPAYGQQPPAYGAPGPYGPPPGQPQPPKKNLLPWLIVGGALLLAGAGIALALLLTGGDSDEGRNDASASTSSAATSSAATSTSASPTRAQSLDDLPGGAQVAEPTVTAGNAFEGSDEVALTWVDALSQGDYETAFGLSCAEVQDASTAAATESGDPAYELGRYFFEQVLGGVGFTGGTFDSIQYDATTDTDVAYFTLDLENGDTFPLLVYVQQDLTVCDFY